jgi:DNA-binding SARP family transcriptional activator/tetratricopeptide (TPR) repeat protein
MHADRTSRLEIRLLGTFGALLDGASLTGFRSAKVRALLAYLAVESGRPHRRDALETLLWGEYPEHDAQRSLSQALTNLRHLLSPLTSSVRPAAVDDGPLLVISRQAVELRLVPDLLWVDLHAFDALLAAADPRRAVAPEELDSTEMLAQAVALYRGSFLAGLSLPGSLEFEEWRLLRQEQCHQSALRALERLTGHHLAEERTDQAEYYARRQLALEPWNEGAHQSLMLTLALDNQRAAALRQYEACRDMLAQELGVAPSAETEALRRQIQDGAWSGAALPARGAPNGSAGTPLARFVDRGSEMAQLHGFLAQALVGDGRVAMVTGEAGAGKTALMTYFARQTTLAHPRLVAVAGRCSTFGGLGDPFLPFQEILQGLCGDALGVHAGYRRNPEEARRLGSIFPIVAQTLVEVGPDLIGRFVPADLLLERAEALAPPGAAWRSPLAELRSRPRQSPPGGGDRTPPGPGQEALFQQVKRVLQTLARRHPLLLLLDDLQWADAASISLLFHLGRNLAGSRILLVGAYRPSELAQHASSPIDRERPVQDRQGGGGRHPLEAVVHEFGRQWGDIQVDLDQAAGRPFVDALLDSVPNRLGEAFRQRLTQHTAGHALFTVELLRMFQDRGALVQDEQGRWMEAPTPYRHGLPSRVEAVIAERVARLPRELRRVLEAAAVEGESFSAEVVAGALGVGADWVRNQLSGPLSGESKLVQPLGVQRLAREGEALSRYRFSHALFHEYLYGHLDDVQQARLHAVIGSELERSCTGNESALAQLSSQLAWHFEAAGLAGKATDYCLQAGRRAMEVAAHQEAVGHFRHGLALLAGVPESAERDRQEVDLQLALGSALFATDGMGSQGQLSAYGRAYELSGQLGQRVALWPALHALASSSTARGQYPKALELGEQLLTLAERAEDPAVLALAHFTLGATLFSSGISLPRSRDHLDQACRTYSQCDDRSRRFLISLNLFDLGVNAWAWQSNVLWILGFADQALRCSRQALEMAQQLDHFLSRVLALYAAGHAYQARGEDQGLRESVEALERLVSGKHLLVGEVWVEVFGGWLLVRAGQVEEGLRRMHQGSEAWQRTGAVFGTTSQLCLVAEACLLVGRPEAGLAAAEKGLALVERTGARPNEAELHRLRGELLLARGQEGDEAEAERCFRRAIEQAQAGEQRRWELRATVSLARLWQRQGRRDEARGLLSGIYGWFTEGFDTAGLAEARALLEQL